MLLKGEDQGLNSAGTFDFYKSSLISGKVEAAVKAMAESGETERGAIFTRRPVVEFILDLAGYTLDKSLHKIRLLEPSFGHGDFLIPAAERLLKQWARRDNKKTEDLLQAITGVELHAASFETTKKKIIELLNKYNIGDETAERLANSWLTQGDFLLIDIHQGFDIVIGNPPYVRQELIDNNLLSVYKALYTTIHDRADLYIPFFERSLNLLNESGNLCFICSDRWMKNQYGGRLRKFVSSGYHLKAYVDMTNFNAFISDVSAYPAITLISKNNPAATRIAISERINENELADLAREAVSKVKVEAVSFLC